MAAWSRFQRMFQWKIEAKPVEMLAHGRSEAAYALLGTACPRRHAPCPGPAVSDGHSIIKPAMETE